MSELVLVCTTNKSLEDLEIILTQLFLYFQCGQNVKDIELHVEFSRNPFYSWCFHCYDSRIDRKCGEFRTLPKVFRDLRRLSKITNEVFEHLSIKVSFLLLVGHSSRTVQSKAHRQKLNRASIYCQTAILPQGVVYAYIFFERNSDVLISISLYNKRKAWGFGKCFFIFNVAKT